MHFLRTIALSALLPMFAITANASPVTYTDTVVASGSLGGVAFTNQTVVLKGTADTSNIFLSSGALTVLSSASVMVGSSSMLSFTDMIVVVDNRGVGSAGFSDLTSDLAILLTSAPAFSNYNLQTSITQIGSNVYNHGASFTTTGGQFVLDSFSGSSTFTAAVTPLAATTPEPSSLCLLGTGVMGCVGGLLRRRRSS